VRTGAAFVLLLGALLAARPVDPAAADPAVEWDRQRALVAQAAATGEALDALELALEPARQAARSGAALVLEGDDSPEPVLNEAAELLDGAAAESDAAVREMDRLRGMVAAARPGVSTPIVPEPGQLASIAGQLRQAGDATGPFVERRRAARRTLVRLEDALAALEADDPQAALPALDDARRARQEVAAWEPAPVTLPLWLETTDRMISSAQRIAEAALAGDEEAARAAAEEYEAAADEARQADVSLALSLSEAGSGLTSTPLRRLADALAEVERAQAVVASLVQSGA
jgi:hypothetical protein